MKHNYIFKLLFVLISFNGISQIPEYYNGIDFTVSGEELELQLGDLVTNTHTILLPYTSTQTDTWDAVKQTDLDPDNNDNVLLFYGYSDSDGNSETDRTRDVNLSCHTSSCSGLWTREHVYAKSIATPPMTTNQPGIGTDVHNLKACDGDMNITRSNRLYFDGTGFAHITSGGRWYPGDEWKGDVARIIMYMHIRYPEECPANHIGVSNNTFHPDMPDIFLQWNIEDPVTEYETQRNTILEDMQGNRNPFIDNPFLATLIWGGNEAEDTWNISLGTTETSLNKFEVYPTIVDSKLYITHSSNSQIKVMIYTMNGNNIEIPLIDNYVDVSNLTCGMYLIKLTTTQSTSTVKFVKN